MKKIETKDAVGHVICHDITIIVKDQIKDTAFQKDFSKFPTRDFFKYQHSMSFRYLGTVF